MKIIVIGPSWIGDMMLSQSLYILLKKRYPAIKIDVIAPQWSRPLLTFMPEVRKSLEIPFHHGSLMLMERIRFGRSLSKSGYHKAFILPNSFKSALIPFFAGIPHRIGWKGEMRYGLLNDVRLLDKKAFPLMIHRYSALAFDKKKYIVFLIFHIHSLYQT